jgi:hypothetical protein
MTDTVLTCGGCGRRTADVRPRRGASGPQCDLCDTLARIVGGADAALAGELPATPSGGEALDTAGALIHYVTSSRARLADFTSWAEHCPGDLDPAEVTRFLAACHDRLAPKCASPIVAPPEVGTRLTPAARCPLCEGPLNRDGSCAASCAGVGDTP